MYIPKIDRKSIKQKEIQKFNKKQKENSELWGVKNGKSQKILKFKIEIKSGFQLKTKNSRVLAEIY